MEKACGSLAWYQAAREVLGALSELRMIGQAPVPTWPPVFAIHDLATVEKNTPEPQLKDLMPQPKKRRGKNSSTHPCSSDVSDRWQIEFACLDFALSKLGSLTFPPGSGLLRAADDAFTKIEPLLREAQLDPALGQFEVEPYGRHPYVWPIMVAVADAGANWIRRVGELWACYATEQLAAITEIETKKPEMAADKRDRFCGKLAAHQAVPDCPLSNGLLGKLAARLELEREWLASREKPKEVENKEGGKQKRGGNNKDSDAWTRGIAAWAAWHKYDPDGRTPAERIVNRTPITNEQLQEVGGISKGTASNLMKEVGGAKRYRQGLRNGSENILKKLDDLFQEDYPSFKSQRGVTEGELAYQSKRVATKELTEEEAFATAKAQNKKENNRFTDEQLRAQVRQLLRGS